MITDTRTLQVWPSGRGYEYRSDGTSYGFPGLEESTRRLRRHTYNGAPAGARWRKGTRAEWADILVECRVEGYIDRDILKCDSVLVSAHLDALPDELDQEWTYENVTNLYTDPDEWNATQCLEWLEEHAPEPTGYEADGIDELRETVRDCAQPAEIYEWWAVTEWLSDQLKTIGEPVLDNNYGYWWGRTCTGQAMEMDGTLQKIARRNP